MLGDLLKAVELLLKTVRGSSNADHKRAALSKELLKIYLNLKEVVYRGREILALLAEQDDPVHRGISIALLTQQTQALNDLRDGLTTGVVGEILQLHLPSLAESLHSFLEVKQRRVWVTLDQLVSDGERLSPTDWTKQLEARMAPMDRAWMRYGSIQSLAEVTDVASPDRFTSQMLSELGRPRVFLLASKEEIEKGHILLDQISLAGEELRKFLVEKFKFEDVL